ncbi:lysoplasmalogenase-like protein TMEM86A [Zerene cesonia]|uniref:lysoplasmalogenase-like protein TMEM86A n=1 Tax=Zerene cesonia TaxID=33412 RepID=UPI0018E579FC|nr:lysoplasmalogenase-like protein TMEM86A [Zerene cesonia]
MVSPTNLLKRVSEGGRLVPFFKAVCIYFTVGCGGAPSVSVAAFKCAPILCLLLCVALRARGRSPHDAYARRVAAGLALSAAGDVCLVWPQYFVAGMGAFAGAHVAYISAFGLRPLRTWGGAAAYGAAALFLRALSPPGALRVAVPLYALLLATMAWRGAARPGRQRLGALLFLLSDAILAYSLFGGPVPYKQVLVMSTYYLGQLCIALSALQQPPRVVEPAQPNVIEAK